MKKKTDFKQVQYFNNTVTPNAAKPVGRWCITVMFRNNVTVFQKYNLFCRVMAIKTDL